MGLVLDWKNTLGYRFDPFEPKVLQPITVYGLDDLKERFNLWLIKGGSLGTISGEKGSGKTMFLRWIETELAPKKSHQQYYIDAKTQVGADDLRQALGTRHGLFSKFLPNKTQDEKALLANLAKQQSVILIDNAGGLHKDALALLGQVLDKTPAHAILADAPERLAKLDVPVKDGLGLRIGRYSNDDLRAIITSRINAAGVADTHPFDNAELIKLLKEADANPAQLLKVARERAIELSLKAGKGQTSAPIATVAQKKKLISISISKESTKEPAAPNVHHAPTSTTTMDAAALNDIIAETAKEPQKQEKKSAQKNPTLTVNELKLFHELASKEEKKQPKKSSVKAAKKKQ